MSTRKSPLGEGPRGSTALLVLLGAALLFGGCVGGCATGNGSAPAKLYRGGPILTMTGAQPLYAEALVERDGEILYVGDEESARSRFGKEATEIDLAGRSLLPGFIDTHVHFGVQAQVLSYDVVEPWRFEDSDAFLDHVEAIARETPKGDWIVVFGYDRILIPPYRDLTRNDLDGATRDHPVLVLYLGLHWASANSLALEVAGIDRTTPTTIEGGGIFFKDDEGEPTGLMTESAVFGLVHHVQTDPGATDTTDTTETTDTTDPTLAPDTAPLREVAKRMSANGITSIADRATGAIGGLAELNGLATLARDPSFPLRIVATPLYQLLPELDAPLEWDGDFQATQVKLLIDASLVGGTSATLDPQRTGASGNLNYSAENYRRAVLEAADKGFSTATHTMGDRGHRVMLDVFEEIQEEVLPVGRHTIEHSALVADEDIPRIAAFGMSVSHLTPLLHVHGDAMRDQVYGDERAARLFDAASIAAAGINLALHSDAPIFEPRPLQYVWVATTRETTSGRALGPEAAITAYAALQGITINAAHHLGLENELGSLAPGKRADLVILDQNPLEVPLEAINEIQVLETIKNGQSYYKR